MSAVPVYDLTGKEIGKAELPDSLFAAPVNIGLLHEVVRAEEAAKRQGTHDTKTRSDVSGGGKKPWKQKGTGRARHGSTRSPIWRGGGTVWGPHPRDYSFKVNRKAKKAALAGALSSRATEERIVGLKAKLDAPKTKTVAAFLKAFDSVKKPLLVHTSEDATLVRSIRNIENASHASVHALSTRTILNSDLLILTSSAIESLAKQAAAAAETEKN